MLSQLKSNLSALFFFVPTALKIQTSISPFYHFISKKLLLKAAVVGTDGTNGI